VSRGDRNRNARLDRLRVLVTVSNAIVGIDLADKKQMVVVTDHDSKVVARKTFRCRAWDLGAALDWAAARAAAKGFAGVTVSCEPTEAHELAHHAEAHLLAYVNRLTAASVHTSPLGAHDPVGTARS
jgi:hypothetical protein